MKIQLLRRGVLIVIVIGSLYGSIQNLLATRDLGSTHDDPITDWETRFIRVKARLPFERGFVGYISDADVPGIPYDEANDSGEYVLTQYVMAPIILVRGTGETWNIGNLSLPAFQAWSATNQGRFDVFAPGNGIYLIRRLGN